MQDSAFYVGHRPCADDPGRRRRTSHLLQPRVAESPRHAERSALDSSSTSTAPFLTLSPRCTAILSIRPRTGLRSSMNSAGWIRHSKAYRRHRPAYWLARRVLPLCSCTILTARSRTSGENLFDFFMAQSSQRFEPPQKPGRFKSTRRGMIGGLVQTFPSANCSQATRSGARTQHGK